ncbi:MAG TPA: hypothetical protein DCR48_06410 [Flavobacteriales bacterium]|nr:hypothetical protein [Flavobacteriales bacterium]
MHKSWNNDGDITDPGEELGFISTPFGTIPPVLIIPFTVPIIATPGITPRMRIVCRESGSAATTQPCGSYTWSETEGFSIFILPSGLTPVVPDTITLASYGDINADIIPNIVGGTLPYT